MTPLVNETVTELIHAGILRRNKAFPNVDVTVAAVAIEYPHGKMTPIVKQPRLICGNRT